MLFRGNSLLNDSTFIQDNILWREEPFFHNYIAAIFTLWDGLRNYDSVPQRSTNLSPLVEVFA